MTGIEINGEFLDLPQNVVLEILRNSPYINNDEIDGEYSLPVPIPYSDKNYRLLSYTGSHYKQHEKQTIDANLYGSGGAIYPGTLVVDGFDKNMNVPGSILSNGLFTFAISSFFQQVKDKKLSDLSFDGPRTYDWTTDAPYDASGGFWQVVHDSFVNPGDYDFTFFPIKNEGYGELASSGAFIYKKIEWMNRLINNAANPSFELNLNVASLCPAIKLSYLLPKMFEELGWKLEGEVLTDATFLKTYCQSFRGIYWADYNTQLVLTVTALASIDINISEHVPPNYPIRNFIIDLKNRYGWAFVFDTNKRTCTLKYLKNIAANGQTKDLSQYANAQVKAKFDQASRIISLINNIEDADSYPQTISSVSIPTIAGVMSFSDLPAAAGEVEGTFCFVAKENIYYQVVTDDTDKIWQRDSDNIGDYLVDGETEAISTDASTLATAFIRYRTNGLFQKWDAIMPICNQLGNWYQNSDLNPWKLRTLLFHGLQDDIYKNGTATNIKQYPMASCYTTDNYGNDLGGNSNVYVYAHGAINNGLYEKAWKDWLPFYKKTDVRTYQFNLPLYLLYDLKWEDIIIIHNAHFLIKKIKYNIPYSGKTELELLKIY